jgi:hypothetical protein
MQQIVHEQCKNGAKNIVEPNVAQYFFKQNCTFLNTFDPEEVENRSEKKEEKKLKQKMSSIFLERGCSVLSPQFL